MHLKITRVSRAGKVYQYAQLVESFRRPDGVATQRVLANLGQRDDLEIANLRKALGASRDGKAVVITAPEHAARPVEVLDNLAWLDVAVVIAILRRLGVRAILDDELPREGAEVADADVALALVAQRCIDPGSKRAAVDWFGRTALPELLGLPESRFNNTRIHRVLTGLESAEAKLQERLAWSVHAHRQQFSLLFLDVTDTWFVGRGPPLATEGKTKEGLYRRCAECWRQPSSRSAPTKRYSTPSWCCHGWRSCSCLCRRSPANRAISWHRLTGMSTCSWPGKRCWIFCKIRTIQGS